MATAVVMMATTSVPVQAAGTRHDFTKYRTNPHPGGIRTSMKPEALGSHGPKFTASKTTTRVVGGTTADSSQFPGVVGILIYSDSGTYICTGTIIAPNKVMTAAHCTTDYSDAAIQVIAGRSNLSDTSGGTVYGVSNVWVPQSFNIAAQANSGATPLDDVAILTLRTAVDPAYTPYQLTAQGDTETYAPSTQAVIAGYGITSDGGDDTGVLHTATIPIVDDSLCASTASDDGDTYDASRMTCAGTPESVPGTNNGVDTCNGDSGGPLFVDGKEAAITDWGPLTGCASSYGYYERMSYYHDSIMADVNRTNMPVNMDFSGDGHADLMFRDPFDTGYLGELNGAGFVYGTNLLGNFGGISDGFEFQSTGWNAYKKLFRVTNWNGDHTESIFAEKSDGSLYQYKTNGDGGFSGKPTLIGSGWTTFNDIMVTNNWLGDGAPNLMGRKSNGDLVLYTSNGQGGWTNSHGTLIGTGWGSFNTIITPGNWRGQGQALIGRNSAGDLKLYESNGHGGWLNTKGTVIGTGWNSLPTFLSPGDWNGDNLIDLIGIAKNGDMKLYRTDGLGHWLNGKGDTMMGFWPSGYFDGLYFF